MTPLTPDAVMARIAAALPVDCRRDVIVIGSLAAGYHFFADDGQRSIRTKDVDCMFAPHARAVAAAGEVTERLLAADWRPHATGAWSKPGDEDTPDDQLPMIRLEPPGAEAGSGWFLELLGAPDQGSEQPRTFHRVRTGIGHFALCSFTYLALAWLTAERDRRDGTEELEAWPERMAGALREHFPGRAKRLAERAGAGLRALMASEGDRDEALTICNRGLLASMEVGRDAFAATGRRVVQQVVDPLAEMARIWPA